MENEKYLFVVSGAAGTGKDSVVKALREAHPEIEKTVSATTRAPRPGETDGVHYYFVTRERFEEMIRENAFLEYDAHAGNYYGTPRAQAEEKMEQGLLLLDIEPMGAKQVKQSAPDAVLIFIMPPSREELERRLRGRGTETEDSIQERLATAQKELAQQDKFTLKLVNDQVDTCADALYQAICQRIGAAE